MIVGTNTAIYSHGSLEEKAGRIRSVGYEGLEVCFSVIDEMHKSIFDMDGKDVARLRDVFSKFKATSIHAFHIDVKPLSIQSEFRNLSQRELLLNLEFAGRLSIPTVVMHPNEGMSACHIDALSCAYDMDAIMRDFMSESDEVAGCNNTKVCWETGCGYFNPFENFDLIRDMGLKNTGICLDVGHLMLTWRNFGVGVNKSILSIGDFISRYGDLILAVHIHDWVADKGKSPHGWNDHNLVGEGEIDWMEVFGSLIKAGYNGLLTCEYHPLAVKNDDVRLARNRAQIIEMIEGLGGFAE
jgi:sugar phosphate isomerase/epimerase